MRYIKIMSIIISMWYIVFSGYVALAQKADVIEERGELNARYSTIVRQLYCSFCDSNDLVNGSTPLAKDLKRQIIGMIKQKKTDQQMGAYITHSYGGTLTYGESPLSDTDKYGPLVVAFLALLAGIIITVKKRKKRNE